MMELSFSQGMAKISGILSLNGKSMHIEGLFS